MNKFYQFIVRHLPRKIIYFATVHLMAKTTTGKYGDTEVPGLTIMEGLKRFGEDNKI